MHSANEIRKEIGDKVFNGVTPRELDALDEKSVRHSLAKGDYGENGSKGHDIVLSWLASKDVERAEESLSISRKALRTSERANKVAISAMILSITTAAIVAIIQFMYSP